ncbi:MAG: ribbon-helix-helix protein, CopG family [Euryarchaeota archaeon]|nr:ribbon-helix-helix protein, CopG family [Euryarchaeota archaeon]
METVPAKMTKRLILELDKLIEEGWYSNRSEAVRDAVRELVEKKRIAMLEAAVREDIEWGLHGE